MQCAFWKKRGPTRARICLPRACCSSAGCTLPIGAILMHCASTLSNALRKGFHSPTTSYPRTIFWHSAMSLCCNVRSRSDGAKWMPLRSQRGRLDGTVKAESCVLGSYRRITTTIRSAVWSSACSSSSTAGSSRSSRTRPQHQRATASTSASMQPSIDIDRLIAAIPRRVHGQ